MIKLKWLCQPIQMAFLLNVVIASFVSNHTVAFIKPVTSISQDSFLQALKFQAPPNNGAPGDRDGNGNGGTRPGCPKVDKPLIALVPEYSYGHTSKQYPTFWFYIPYQSNNQRLSKLVLWDEAGEKIYESSFQITNTPGIVSIPLIDLEPGKFKIGEKYKWEFYFYCSAMEEDHIKRYGWIKQVEPLSEDELKGLELREIIALYAEKGMWFDLLTTLAQQRRIAPENTELAEDWQDLLEAVDLQQITSEELVPCCHLENERL